MILTLTPNPSIDATLNLQEAINPGAVHRASLVSQVAGGKGVNVTHAVHLAGEKSVALLPARKGDHFLTLMEDGNIPFDAVSMPGSVRTNTTITEPGGRTTKVNGPGPELNETVQSAISSSLAALSIGAEWVVLAGSLPKGVPTHWYATLVDVIRTAAPQARIAVDTSDAPMVALAERLNESAPNLIKPNGLELGQLTDTDGNALEAAAEQGDYSGVVEAARVVVGRGVDEVLVTLGGAGAVLVTADGAWAATPPPTAVTSTVGAGDSALAGYILARRAGKDFAEALRQSVAYGSAAAALPGTQLPKPAQVNIAETKVLTL